MCEGFPWGTRTSFLDASLKLRFQEVGAMVLPGLMAWRCSLRRAPSLWISIWWAASFFPLRSLGQPQLLFGLWGQADQELDPTRTSERVGPRESCSIFYEFLQLRDGAAAADSSLCQETVVRLKRADM